MQPYEVGYLAEKTGLPASVVRDAIRKVGPMRRDVERYLAKKKRSRR